MDSIVLVDDEPEILEIQKESLNGLGADVQTFTDPIAAWDFIQSGDASLVVTDWNMPGMTGMDLLFKIRGLDQPPYVIVLTAFGTVDRAVQAMNQGAFNFLEKPFKLDRYLSLVKDALFRLRNARQEAEHPRRTSKSKIPTVPEPIVAAPAMQRVYDTARSAAGTDSSVLLLGESGTGKEVLADFVHRNSARAAGPIVKVNCGALPEHLMESELFGHEKGAFTGADKRNIGRFEQANGGTLFLDEIGDLLLPLQVKLLRALQDRSIERVGSSAQVRVDFRLICATHQNLKSLAQSGKFREDLYYRINVVPIRVPALRDRREDIQPLAEYFLEKLVSRKTGPQRFSPEAMQCLKVFNWPGNVRQLRNAVEYALVLCKKDVIEPADLPEEVRAPATGSGAAHASTSGVKHAALTVLTIPAAAATAAAPASSVEEAAAGGVGGGLRNSVKGAEAELIRNMLIKNHWRMTKVAQELQISRSTLYQRMKEYGIKKP